MPLVATTETVRGGSVDAPGRGAPFPNKGVVGSCIRYHSIDNTSRNDDVIALLIRQRTEHRLKLAGTLVDKDQIVAVRILIEVRHRLNRSTQRDADVVVQQEHLSTSNRISTRRKVMRLDVVMLQRLDVEDLDLRRGQRLEVLGLRGEVDVVQRRRNPRKPFSPKDLLRVKRPIRLPKLRMPLMWNRT